MDDEKLTLNVTFKPPPPKETPVQELKRGHTASELRNILLKKYLSTRGSKDDLVFRLAKSESLIDIEDVNKTFTRRQLNSRVSDKSGNKLSMCETYFNRL